MTATSIVSLTSTVSNHEHMEPEMLNAEGILSSTKLWTVEDVAQLPDDDLRYALIRGVPYRQLPRWPQDGRIVVAIGYRLSDYIVEHRLGFGFSGRGFILKRDPDTLLCPDLSIVRGDRWSQDEDGYPELAPDLVVEVASPSQTGPSIEEKTTIYLSVGVRLIWIIAPERRTVRVRRQGGTEALLSERDEIDGEDVLPGFRLPVRQFFN
jgi:Uma2 family endonuclease